jgi:exopolyphosphatase / guanosine-5'-triphosphate,3'-diphosphate pyrophosphatase
MILGAIDIGSNAARLLITETAEYAKGQVVYNKVNLFRVPLRLGFDVFATGTLSEDRHLALLDTMFAFSKLMQVHKVQHHKIAATSALRDAQNGKQVIEDVLKHTGLQIKIISGDEEAAMLFESHAAEEISNGNHHLYIDVGGGSTELTLFVDGEIKFKHSYNVGTIRFLTNTLNNNEWQEMKAQCKLFAKQYNKLDAIGTGGNINKAYSLGKLKEGKPMDLDYLKKFHEELSELSLQERMAKYKLKADRADVLVPALLIYSSVMKWTGCKQIYVPNIGVADGLIRALYKELGF